MRTLKYMLFFEGSVNKRLKYWRDNRAILPKYMTTSLQHEPYRCGYSSRHNWYVWQSLPRRIEDIPYNICRIFVRVGTKVIALTPPTNHAGKSRYLWRESYSWSSVWGAQDIWCGHRIDRRWNRRFEVVLHGQLVGETANIDDRWWYLQSGVNIRK